MRHLIKKNPWECLLYSFAMALDTFPELLMSALGYTGGETMTKNSNLPRGFHVQDFVGIS